MALSLAVGSEGSNVLMLTLVLLLGMLCWIAVILYYYRIWRQYYGRYFWTTLGAGCMLMIPVFSYLNVAYEAHPFLGTLFAFLDLVAYMLGALFFLKGGFAMKEEARLEREAGSAEHGHGQGGAEAKP
jgi:hypothetical protein